MEIVEAEFTLVTLINDYGFPIIMALGMGYFIYFIWTFINEKLDPAIEELFINQNSKMLYTIPGLIILAFALKGSSLYLAKILMIAVSQEVRRDMQIDMFNSLIIADTQLINKKHSGSFLTALMLSVDNTMSVYTGSCDQ